MPQQDFEHVQGERSRFEEAGRVGRSSEEDRPGFRVAAERQPGSTERPGHAATAPDRSRPQARHSWQRRVFNGGQTERRLREALLALHRQVWKHLARETLESRLHYQGMPAFREKVRHALPRLLIPPGFGESNPKAVLCPVCHSHVETAIQLRRALEPFAGLSEVPKAQAEIGRLIHRVGAP